jgi:putative two-component system response regulator
MGPGVVTIDTELRLPLFSAGGRRQSPVQRRPLDWATEQHGLRVAGIARELAAQLDLAPSLQASIEQAAALHDVGKLGVPEDILLKPGKLTADEFAEVKLHTTIGANMLSAIDSPNMRLAEQIALTHHEWWDGSGYPNGLIGTEIPLAGRIVALADVFDALTRDRPYRKACPIEQAVGEICHLRARQFDPDVVDAFIALNPYELFAALTADRVAASAAA